MYSIGAPHVLMFEIVLHIALKLSIFNYQFKFKNGLVFKNENP